MRRRIVKVRQRESNDCGVACLASVAAYYGLRLPLPKLHHLADTDRAGTTALGLVQAATTIGFLAKGVRSSLESLTQVNQPTIAHVVIQDRQHYVVVYEATARRIVYMDPQDGAVHTVSPEEFQRSWTGVLILLAPGKHFRIGDETIPAVRRIWELIRPHRSAMLQALTGAALYTILGLSTAIYVQKIVDQVFAGGNQNLLNLMSVVMLALAFLQLFFGVAQDLLMLGVARRIDGQLILSYYNHLIQLPHRFFTTRRVGDLVTRVNDAVKIRSFVNGVLLDATLSALVLVSSIALMFMYSWKLALLLLAVLPLYGLVYGLTDRINRHNERAVTENMADLQSWLVESVEGILTVKHLTMEDHASLRTESRLVRLLRTLDRSARVAIGSTNAAALISRVAVIAVLWTGGTMVLRQSITPGELLSLYALLAYLTGPVASLVSMNRELHGTQIAADRLFEIFALSTETASEGEIELTPDLMGDIVFEDVSFCYGAGPPVFQHLSMVIPQDKVTAIVGESGSGKSTILALLHKRESPEQGRIRIGGIDMAHMTLRSVRQRLGVVPQKVELFSGNVLSNIAVNEHKPDMKKLLLLAERLGISEFVERLPMKFSTQLGEQGATLSGGQRQRLAIARALYRDPDVLVLDEATSSLDSTSEQRIRATIAELREDIRTIVVIAHRLSTVRDADKIIVLQHGAVAEEGTHTELIERHGVYHDLWMQQFPTAASAERLERSRRR